MNDLDASQANPKEQQPLITPRVIKRIIIGVAAAALVAVVAESFVQLSFGVSGHGPSVIDSSIQNVVALGAFATSLVVALATLSILQQTTRAIEIASDAAEAATTQADAATRQAMAAESERLPYLTLSATTINDGTGLRLVFENTGVGPATKVRVKVESLMWAEVVTKAPRGYPLDESTVTLVGPPNYLVAQADRAFYHSFLPRLWEIVFDPSRIGDAKAPDFAEPSLESADWAATSETVSDRAFMDALEGSRLFSPAYRVTVRYASLVGEDDSVATSTYLVRLAAKDGQFSITGVEMWSETIPAIGVQVAQLPTSFGADIRIGDPGEATIEIFQVGRVKVRGVPHSYIHPQYRLDKDSVSNFESMPTAKALESLGFSAIQRFLMGSEEAQRRTLGDYLLWATLTDAKAQAEYDAARDDLPA